jgi:hypothetical protein
MLANQCNIEGKYELYQLQLKEWEEWLRNYIENPEIVPPPPERPITPDSDLSSIPEDKDECKMAYSNIVKKQNSNSVQLSTNMRKSYFIRNQHRVPLLTAWY